MTEAAAAPDDHLKNGKRSVAERMQWARAHRKPSPTGPYSRVLLRGARSAYNGRSREGRFVAHLESELVKHIGGQTSITQKLLIGRVINLQMQLLLFDQKLAAGAVFTPHDLRTFAGISNAFKNALRELGHKPAAAARPAGAALDDFIAGLPRRGEAA